jgi:non-ribosomal peptide synthetase component F
MLAAFASALSRFTGQDDLALGTSVAARTRPELEDLVGFVANVLVMRVDLSARPTFREAVARVHRLSGESFAHQDVPFDLVVKTLRPQRTVGVNPLFQVLFLYLQDLSAASALPGVTFRERPLASVAAKYDLSLHVVDDGAELHGLIEYKSALFEPSTMQRFRDGWLSLLAAAAETPDRPVAELPVLPAVALARLISSNRVQRLVRRRGRPMPLRWARCRIASLRIGPAGSPRRCGREGLALRPGSA